VSIHVVCSNGHALKIKEKYAGAMGLCPMCRVPIKIPDPSDVFGDESIMDVLQPHESGLSGVALQVSDIPSTKEGSSIGPQTNVDTTAKVCTKCGKGSPESAHICPYCHTYMPKLQMR
jgi:hypothetical protein